VWSIGKLIRSLAAGAWLKSTEAAACKGRLGEGLPSFNFKLPEWPGGNGWSVVLDTNFEDVQNEMRFEGGEATTVPPLAQCLGLSWEAREE
jgi:hypothetical protein